VLKVQKKPVILSEKRGFNKRRKVAEKQHNKGVEALHQKRRGRSGENRECRHRRETVASSTSTKITDKYI